MGKPSPPKPPDPKETASGQTGTNVSTAIANSVLQNPNQTTPYGSLDYQFGGEDGSDVYTYTDPYTDETYSIPKVSVTQTLSDDQQQMLDNNTQAGINMSQIASDQSARIGDILNTPFTLDDLPERQQYQPAEAPSIDRLGAGTGGDITRTYGTDFSEDRQRVEDALMERMAPQLDRRQEQLEARLASQGIRMGSEQYQDAMDDYYRSENDASLGAILSAGQEQSRLAGIEANRAGFENSAQAQAFGQEQSLMGQNNAASQQEFMNYLKGLDAQNANRNATMEERFAVRNQPLNEITALLSGSQVQSPNFTNANLSGIPTTDVAGLINENFDQKMGVYNSELGSWNNTMGGLLGFGGAILSDRRLKRDIRMVRDGVLPVYEYRYIWDTAGTRRRGYMAQDALRVAPWAVRRIGKWLALDYSQLPEVS